MVLFFNCLLTFGSYFCFDIPSVLQDQFQGVSEQQWLSADQSWLIALRESHMNFLSLQNLTCANTTVINGTVDCVLGLGMTPQQYNLLYAIYAWTYVHTHTHTQMSCEVLMKELIIYLIYTLLSPGMQWWWSWLDSWLINWGIAVGLSQLCKCWSSICFRGTFD